MKRFTLVLCVLLCVTLTACSGPIDLLAPFRFIPGFGHRVEQTKGNSATAMPDCSGWTKQEVEEYFGERGYTVGFTYQPSDSIQKDTVIMQGVEVGAPLQQDTILVFILSQGVTECPYAYSQKLLLTVAKGSTRGTMQLQNWQDGGWQTQYTCAATVGKNGAGANYGEGKGVTPVGVFKLGVILCQTPPAGNWPYRTVSTNTCIVDDTASPLYNTIQNKADLPAGTHVDTIGDTIINGNTHQCMYIEHNGDGLSASGVVAGKGSAITVCGKTTSLYATNGCVDISAGDLSAILAKLNYQNNPHIEIVVQ